MAQVERGAGVLGSPRGDVFLSLPTLPCGSASSRTQPMGSPSKRVWSGRRGGAGEGLRLSVPDDQGPVPRPLGSSTPDGLLQLQALMPLPALDPSSQGW